MRVHTSTSYPKSSIASSGPLIYPTIGIPFMHDLHTLLLFGRHMMIIVIRGVAELFLRKREHTRLGNLLGFKDTAPVKWVFCPGVPDIGVVRVLIS